MSGKSKESDAPDFAYPRQVMADADKMLDKALKKGDGQGVVKALIQSGLAQVSISPDSLPSVITRIEGVRDKERGEVTKALLDLLLAEVYSQYYTDNQYDLDRRPTLAAPGTDITLWSGKEFRDRIMGLYDEVFVYTDALRAARITDYTDIIECDSSTPIFYPTLFDFASLRALDVLDEINSESITVLAPFYLYDVTVRVPNVMSKPSAEAVEIANRWVLANEGAPRIMALLVRYSMLEGKTVRDDNVSGPTPLMRLYAGNKSVPYAVELLLAENIYQLDMAQQKALYNELNEYQATNPSYFRIDAVKNRMAELTQPRCEVSYPAQVARGKDFIIGVKLDNASAADVLVYRVNDSAVRFDRDSYRLQQCGREPVARLTVKTDSVAPFSEMRVVTCNLKDYGVYVVVPVLEDGARTNMYVDAIYCTDIALAAVNSAGLMRAYAVDGTSGIPQKGVNVTTYRNYDNQLQKLRTHLSDADGAVDLDKGNLRNIIMQATKGDDRFGRELDRYIPRYDKGGVTLSAFVRPALAIYHPGDTLDFVAITYRYSGNERSLVKDTDFKAVLRNPNYVTVDTVDIHTDGFGRATAKFRLPDEGLTGEYTISVLDAKSLRRIGSETVMVSDYKLPTYEAKVDSVTIDEAQGSVTVNCRAMTYSGFPVQNASAVASLAGLQRYWWNSHSVKFHTDTLTTDAEGRFSWTLSKEVLEQTPFMGGRYRVDFTVTSPSGENRFCSKEFSLGKTNVIMVDHADWLAATPSSNLHISVNDALGKPIDARLHLTFKGKDGATHDYDVESIGGVTKADLSQLHSGEYELTVTAPGIDAEAADATVTVYNTADSNSPVDALLWTPRSMVRTSGRSADVVYATALENARVLVIISSGDSICDTRWIAPVKGINRLKVELPAGKDEVKVLMATVADFNMERKEIEVVSVNPDDELKVKIERMRDRLTPLTDETVTVKVTNGAGKGVDAAVILDMYSKALDNLAVQSWSFSPSRGYVPGIDFSSNLCGITSADVGMSLKYLKAPELCVTPEFNFYDMPWTGYSHRMMKYDAMTTAHPMLRSKAPIGMMNKMDGAVLYEDSADTAALGAVEEAESEIAGETTVSADKEQYRPSEVPLAFFAPMLSTDADGNLAYSFKVPNANTTWVLKALSYSTMLATDLDVCEVISAKPVMVEPNLPRFIRTGDKAVVSALVMNASTEAAEIATLFEVIDPTNGKVVDTQSVTSAVEAGQSATVDFNIDAPAAPGALIVRVKSSTDVYSDGVQTLLPVLSSSQPVIESSTFYMSPDQKELQRELPGEAKDVKVTLSFCENPTWEVVSALPGLRTDDPSTSLGASAQIFAAAVSGYVMKLNPAIEPALKAWLNDAKDSGEMLSMLNRNDDLKQMYLAATPWVQEAQSDEDRIARLALLFDSKEIQRSIDSAVKKLKKMQRAGGGWSWTLNYDEPSLWVTLQILNNFAELRQLGCCPVVLDDMVKDAWRYVDAEIAAEYSRYPDTTYSFYTYVRSLYRDMPMPTSAQKAYNATVQSTLKNWKKSNPAQKAADALILYRNDYKEVARTVLASVREFATSTPELGMWWETANRSSWWALAPVGQTAFILQAFNTIEPGCEDIDKIRQWLILNKVVQDWGTSVDATVCVASILQCGSSWLNRPGDAVITIDGSRFEPDRIDKLTGKFVAEIPDAKGELVITRSVDGPAWGAVIEQSTQVMKDVKAHSIPELSIEKEALMSTDKGWAPSSEFTVGQVVKVRLVINAKRAMDYVSIVDNRAATFEPVVQTPRPVYCDGLVFYLENRDAATNIFIDHLPKGQYVIEYEMNVNNAGEYASGLATIQSQYAPEMTAHSSGNQLTVTR